MGPFQTQPFHDFWNRGERRSCSSELLNESCDPRANPLRKTPAEEKRLSISDRAPLLQMGYANPEQVGGGLLSRLYSRAFIVADPESSRRVVFVSADIGMVSQRVRLEVQDGKRGAAAFGISLGKCCVSAGEELLSPQQTRLDFAHSSLSGKITRSSLEPLSWCL